MKRIRWTNHNENMDASSRRIGRYSSCCAIALNDQTIYYQQSPAAEQDRDAPEGDNTHIPCPQTCNTHESTHFYTASELNLNRLPEPITSIFQNTHRRRDPEFDGAHLSSQVPFGFGSLSSSSLSSENSSLQTSASMLWHSV